MEKAQHGKLPRCSRRNDKHAGKVNDPLALPSVIDVLVGIRLYITNTTGRFPALLTLLNTNPAVKRVKIALLMELVRCASPVVCHVAD